MAETNGALAGSIADDDSRSAGSGAAETLHFDAGRRFKTGAVETRLTARNDPPE